MAIQSTWACSYVPILLNVPNEIQRLKVSSQLSGSLPRTLPGHERSVVSNILARWFHWGSRFLRSMGSPRTVSFRVFHSHEKTLKLARKYFTVRQSGTKKSSDTHTHRERERERERTMTTLLLQARCPCCLVQPPKFIRPRRLLIG
jgi:hypothetical protein